MLGTLLTLVLASPVQSVDFKPQAVPGSEIRVEVSSYLEIELTSKDRANPSGRQRIIKTTLDEVYIQTIREQADGRAKRLTLVCKKSTLDREGTGLEGSGAEPTPRHGKTLTAAWSGADRRHTVTINGKPPAKPGSAFVGRWEDIVDLLPPTGSSSAGDLWKRPFKALAFLNAGGTPIDDIDGELTCSLARVQNRVATIHFEGTLRCAPSEDETLSLKVEGDLDFDLDAGRPVSLSMKGDIVMYRTVIEEEYHPETMYTHRIDAGSITLRSKKWTSNLKFKTP